MALSDAMHISLLPTSPPPRHPGDSDVVNASLAWLRRELERTALTERRAALHHEIAHLTELTGDDSAAVKDFLAAVNGVSGFREPLERLITLVERHRSHKNLPTLLEHYRDTARTSDELLRAQISSAWLWLTLRPDAQRAARALETALEAEPFDAVALASLEVVARRSSDSALLRRALSGRALATSDPRFRSLLKLDLAQAQLDDGDAESAFATLDEVRAESPSLAAVVLDRQIRIARERGQRQWLRSVLTASLERVQAMANGRLDRSRLRARATDLCLQIAQLEQLSGNADAALTFLEQCEEVGGHDAVVARALLRHATASGDPERLESIALGELKAGARGEEAAALWLRVARARRERHALTEAMQALERCIVELPGCWIAHATRIEFARGSGDAEALARSLESVAGELDTPLAKGRYWLAAADVWARARGDAESAMQALSCAEGAGLSAAVVHRAGRALASAMGDQVWYDAATRFLIDAEPGTGRKASLALELLRAAMLAGDEAECRRLRRLLSTLPESRVTSHLLVTCWADSTDEVSAADAWNELAALEPDPERSVALRWLASLNSHREGGVGIETLRALHREWPHLATLAGTLISWLEAAGSPPQQIVDVLSTTAHALSDDAFAGSLFVEAGIRAFRTGDGPSALELFGHARQRGTGPARALQHWAARAAGVATEAERGDPAERLVRTIENYPKSVEGDLQVLQRRAQAVAASPHGELTPLVAAADLLTLLASLEGTHGDCSRSLDRFARANADCSQLAAAWSHLHGMRDADVAPGTLEANARAWFDGEKNVAAALEWLSAAQRLPQRGHEYEARMALAGLLDNRAAELCRTTAAITWQLSRVEPAPYLDGQSNASRLTNLDTSPPGCDPRRRAAALAAVEPLLGEDDRSMAALLRGYDELAAGEPSAAATSFRRYAKRHPDDPTGWEGLLECARATRDAELLKEATAALARTASDTAHVAQLCEETAEQFFDELDDPVSGESALSKAVALDVRRHSSFERLFELALKREDWSTVLDMAVRRLHVLEDGRERHQLEWERARAARQLGDTEQALDALDRVIAQQPRHVGALALHAEILVTEQRYADAAERLVELAALSEAGAGLRLTSGLAAVDLLENKLEDTERSLEVLSMLHRAGLHSLPLRERLARAAAKSEAWDDATAVLEQLMFERETVAQRAEAARLSLAIHRDRIGDVGAAGSATERLLELVPADPEALDLVFSGAFDPDRTQRLLHRTTDALCARLSQEPIQSDDLACLARVARAMGDARLRQVTLGAMAALGPTSQQTREELDSYQRGLTRAPCQDRGLQDVPELCPPRGNPIYDLLVVARPWLAAALDSGPRAVAQKPPVRADRDSAASREVAAWARCIGTPEPEVYVSEQTQEPLIAHDAEPPVVVLSGEASAPLSPGDRQAVVRQLLALRRCSAVVGRCDANELATLVAALCSLGGSDLAAAGSDPSYEALRSQLESQMPPDASKLLAAPARSIASGAADPISWARTELRSLDCAAALAVGDISLIARVECPTSAGDTLARERIEDLIRFVLSPSFERARDHLGLLAA